MTYSTSNPPFIIAGSLDADFRIWGYASTDAIAAVDATDYVTNASDLGMQTGDAIIIKDTTNGLVSMGTVTVDTDGNATFTALTAFP